MSSKDRNGKWYRICFWFLVAAYALILLVAPRLGPNDDFVFLRTLQAGKPLLYFSPAFPYYDTIALGRFGLLSSIEYNLVALFSNTPFWYFFLHAIQLGIFALMFIKILKKTASNEKVAYIFLIFLFLLPGFTIPWFRLQLPERNILFFFAAFVLSYLAYVKNRSVPYLLASAVFANIAIYYKEVPFVALGVFAFVELLALRKTNDLKRKVFNAFVLLSSFIYLISYYFFVFRRSALLYLPYGLKNPALSFLKNIMNYGFFSDPLLVLIVLPLAFWRIYKVVFEKDNIVPLYDPFLAAAATYAAVFFALNIYSPYYLLPAYLFAIPAIVYFFKNYSLKSLPLFFKTVGIITLVLILVNTIPSGIHQLTYNKYLPYNFNTTLDFLVEDLRAQESKNSRGKPSIFLAGVDRGAGRGTYFILADYLHYRGIENSEYDMKSAMSAAEPFSPVTKIQLPFSVFKAGPADEPQQGDYLIVTPQATQNIDEAYLNNLRKKYKLVFQTSSPLAFPDLNLKTLVKRYLLRKSANGNAIIKDENLLQLPDYYLFIKT